MNTNQLFKHVMNNGGVTINPKNLKVAHELHYVASLKNHETKIPIPAFNQKVFKAVLTEYQKLVNEGLYIGIWLFNNHAYIDVSQDFKDKKEALDFAKVNEQLAIFNAIDNKSEEVIK